MPSSPDDSLRELQQQFVREVLYRDAPGVLSRISGGGTDVQRRLGIYRTNARENFALALEAAFPLLLRCVGREEFRQLAWAYQRACPSPAGNLFHVGRQLPAFLAGRLTGDRDEYLIDVARLEWAVQESMVAADGPTNGPEGLDLAALAAVPAEHQADIRFRLHPSVRLLRTKYGVYALWEALQAGSAVTPAAPAAEGLVVLRRAAGVELRRLDGGLAATDLDWLEALRGGTPLGEAAGSLPVEEQENLGALLVRWVAAGVITSFN